MKMCPEAKIDDGFLDVTYVQNVEPEKVPELMQVVLTGKKEDELSESIKTMRVTWLEVLLIMWNPCMIAYGHQGLNAKAKPPQHMQHTGLLVL